MREVRSDRVFRVELANGHKLWAWLPKYDVGRRNICVGDHVRVEVSVFDVSHGRIVLPRERCD